MAQSTQQDKAQAERIACSLVFLDPGTILPGIPQFRKGNGYLGRRCGSVGRIHKATGVDPQYHVNWSQWHTPIFPALGKQKQKDQKFKIGFCYLVNSRQAWATGDQILKKFHVHQKCHKWVLFSVMWLSRHTCAYACTLNSCPSRIRSSCSENLRKCSETYIPTIRVTHVLNGSHVGSHEPAIAEKVLQSFQPVVLHLAIPTQGCCETQDFSIPFPVSRTIRRKAQGSISQPVGYISDTLHFTYLH